MDLWTEINDGMEEERNDLVEHLANGTVSDYPNYMQVVGKIAGIKLAQDIMAHVVKTRVLDDE